MSFWDLNTSTTSDTAIVDSQRGDISYAALANLVSQRKGLLGRRHSRSLVFLLCDNQLDDVLTYLACLQAGHVPLLLSAATDASALKALEDIYQPNWVARGKEMLQRESTVDIELHPDLALLLTTSGSTGSPKLVRLSHKAVQSNAESIATYLQLDRSERAITSLPINYSYGLSVLNSHLQAGAATVLTNQSVLSKDFGPLMERERVTSLAGVPYSYQMLYRIGFLKQNYPSLRTLTQAGGKLDQRFLTAFGDHAEQRKMQLVIMYGQTEACARMSYLPSDKLKSKQGSIGIAIPGGQLSIDPSNGELIYRGQNVMMGYAEQLSDLALGNCLGGVLRTGDTGTQDEDGYFFISGRLKRFIKLGGVRTNLDEIEQGLSASLNRRVAAAGEDDKLKLQIEGDETGINKAKTVLREQYGIHHSMVKAQAVDEIARLSSGKTNYAAI